MAANKMKECLELNRYLYQALSKQLEGSPSGRDQILMQTQTKLLDVMKELLKESNAQPLFDLQTELSRIVAAEEIDVEEVFRFHQLLSKAMMRKNSKRETLILVNMDISQAMVDGSQKVIREKLVSVLGLLSQGMADGTGNDDVKDLFKLNEALSKAVAEKSEEKKLDLIATSNLHLAEFMVAGYPDTSTEWLMELNRIAALAMVLKNRNPTFLQKSIYSLSREMRNSEDEELSKNALELIYTLSSMLIEADVGLSFFDQLVTWKIQLSTVMEELLGESSRKAMKKATDEGMAVQVQTAALQAENRRKSVELDELIQARDACLEEARRLQAGKVSVEQEIVSSKKTISELVSGISKTEEALRIPEIQKDEQIIMNAVCAQKVDSSSLEVRGKIPEEAEISKVGRKADEVKSEAPYKKEFLGGGGSGTRPGGVKSPTGGSSRKRVNLHGANKGPMNEVYLPPVTQHKGNREASPRGQGSKSQHQETA